MTGATDSHGLPWAHRELSMSEFADDDGAPDPRVLDALVRLAGSSRSDSGATGSADRGPVGEREAMAVVAAARWLVPVVALGVDTEIRDGMRVQGHAEMATVTLTSADGSRALPVFSGLPALAAWDPAARPVPMTADRAAQAAVAEGCDTLLLDVGSEHAVALRPSMLWALAMCREWLPAHEDPTVAIGLAAALAGEQDVVGHQLGAGEPADGGVLRVTLWLRTGLDAPAVQALATRVGERLATDGELRARIDALAFAVRAAQ